MTEKKIVDQICSGKVLDDRGLLIDISEQVRRERVFLDHLARGEVLHEGEWVSIGRLLHNAEAMKETDTIALDTFASYKNNISSVSSDSDKLSTNTNEKDAETSDVRAGVGISKEDADSDEAMKETARIEFSTFQDGASSVAPKKNDSLPEIAEIEVLDTVEAYTAESNNERYTEKKLDDHSKYTESGTDDDKGAGEGGKKELNEIGSEDEEPIVFDKKVIQDDINKKNKRKLPE